MIFFGGGGIWWHKESQIYVLCLIFGLVFQHNIYKMQECHNGFFFFQAIDFFTTIAEMVPKSHSKSKAAHASEIVVALLSIVLTIDGLI